MRKIIVRAAELAACVLAVYMASADAAQAGIGFLAETHIGFFVVGIVVGALAIYLFRRSK